MRSPFEPKPAPDLERVADVIAARGGRLGRPLHLARETASTNDDAKAGAKAGAPHGAVWLAETQTKGRGRHGRSWAASAGESLLFSVVLRLGCPPAAVPPLSLACGLAVRDAIAAALGRGAPRVMVKWPNDVVIAEADGSWKKAAGILVESSLVGMKVEHVVVGVGVNVHVRAFPEELAPIATSLALALPAGAEALDRATLLADILARLDHDVEHVAHRGLGIVQGRLAEHDALVGRAVEADEVTGLASGIAADGRLLVRTEAGETVKLASGEVKLRLR